MFKSSKNIKFYRKDHDLFEITADVIITNNLFLKESVTFNKIMKKVIRAIKIIIMQKNKQ